MPMTVPHSSPVPLGAGDALGFGLGSELGTVEGVTLGAGLGTVEGVTLGFALGSLVGVALGTGEGFAGMQNVFSPFATVAPPVSLDSPATIRVPSSRD